MELGTREQALLKSENVPKKVVLARRPDGIRIDESPVNQEIGGGSQGSS